MTISTSTSRISYNGNAVTTVFSVPFRFFANADLVVELVDADDVSTSQVLDTDYTVTGADDDAGGSLTMVVAPGATERLVIRRVISATQEVDYLSGDTFPAETHERALDRLTMLAQQNEASIARALVFPTSESTSGMIPTITERALKTLSFDALGNPVAVVPTTDSAADVRIDLASTASGDGAGLSGFDWAVIPAAIDKADWGIQTAANGINVLRYIPPSEWAAIKNGTSTTDLAPYIQACFDDVRSGSAIYFPKLAKGNGVGSSYKIDTGLVLQKDDITIYGDPSSEYSDGFYTSSAIDMLTVKGYGLKMENMAFIGDGATLTFGYANGLVIDRSSLGDAETYSNLDSSIKNCFFWRLDDCIRGVGRNVFVIDNLFSESKRGIVGEPHTYSGGTVSSFRGWRVRGNRFHAVGGQYINALSSETLPATMDLLDSWCIQMPITSNMTSHLEIFNNNADFCGAGFYKGYLAGATINGNITYGGSSAFVYSKITDSGNQSASSNSIQSIRGNTINSRVADQTTDRGYLFSTNTIYTFGVANLVIAGNDMHNAAESHIVVTACARVKVKDNNCSNGNLLFTDTAVQKPGINVDQSANARIIDNDVWSAIGTVYNYGILATSCTSLKIAGNRVDNATAQIGATASDLVTARDEGLPWQTPTMTNAYVLGSNSRGYRRLFNGMVEIDVSVTGGADNVSAFQLPAGYRPASPITLSSVAVWTDGSDAYAQIETSGLVNINWNSGAAGSYNVRHIFEAA